MPDFAHVLLTAEFWRRHRLAIGYGGLGLVLFLVFLASNFPYGDALASLLAPFNLSLTYTDHRARLPIGAELDGVTLTDTLIPGSPPLLDGATVTLSPALGSLLLARPGVDVSAELYGGSLDLVLYHVSNGIGLGVDANGLDLSRYRQLARYGINLRGRLSGTLKASLPGADPMLGTGEMHLQIGACTIRIVRGLPSLRLGDLNGTAHLDHGLLTIERLTGKGGDFTGSATGTIQFAADLPESRLDLHLKLQPTAAARKRLEFMLQLLPHPPGPEPYYIHGSLAAPAIS